MKKLLYLLLFFTFSIIAVSAQTEFIKALPECTPFSQDGSIIHKGEVFNLKITLEKGKKNKCIYKEKIYQDIGYEVLTCEFNKNQLQYIANSMSEYTETYKKQLAKNKIYEAKLTSNGAVFQRYLVNPQYCKITYSKKK